MEKKITYNESTAPFLFEDELDVDIFETVLQEVDMKDEPLPHGVIMRVRGKAHHSNHVTANGTLYTTERYQNAINLLRDELDSGSVMMGPRHPVITRNPATKEIIAIEAFSPGQSVGLIRRLEILPDGWVMFEADIGDTDNGKDTAAMIRMGAKVPISSRARGSHKLITLTDKHPAAKDNPESIGKQVKEIQDDFRLKTYDTVEAAASGGSETTNWREEKENEMEFDISKLSEDQWKAIKESDVITKLIAEAVDAKAKVLKEEFDTAGIELVKKMVSETVNSDEFIAKIREANKTDEAETGECEFCKEVMVEGMMFCPACGRKPLDEAKFNFDKLKKGKGKKGKDKEDEKEGDTSDLEKQVADLKKKNEDLAATVAELKNKNDKDEETVKIDAKVNEALADTPMLIVERVRADLSSRELTEDTVEAIVAASIKRVEDVFKVAGIKVEELPKEIGKNITEDEQTKNKPNKAVQGQQGMLKNI